MVTDEKAGRQGEERKPLQLLMPQVKTGQSDEELPMVAMEDGRGTP